MHSYVSMNVWVYLYAFGYVYMCVSMYMLLCTQIYTWRKKKEKGSPPSLSRETHRSALCFPDINPGQIFGREANPFSKSASSGI